MVSCAEPETARRVRLLRNQGMEKQYANELVGLNNRMTDIHAAIGRVQLTKVGGWTAARQANAAFLNEHLDGVVVPPVAQGAVHVYHQYTIRVAEDRGIRTAALSGGVAINTAVRTTIVGTLESRGLACLMNERYPLGDGCISYGQCVMAAALLE